METWIYVDAFHSQFHRMRRKIEKARGRRRSRRSRHSRSRAIHLEGNPADFSLILWCRHGGLRVYFLHGWRYLKNPLRNFFSSKEGSGRMNVLKVPLGAVKMAPKWASIKSSMKKRTRVFIVACSPDRE